ncbi:MAG TPA: DNA mismatch repair endonuclease MutL [Nitrospirae bacterium]|nr:DNA mismatch repair endonuclease MutL [Nitrospirota bacterium]
MGLIKILPEDIKNKISAGEVIERPASVVKELIENSIDARSTRIDIEISSAGKRLIKVSDNGLGMSVEDLPMSILPHATSKISTEKDLFDIHTLGFRGEALASISSVSKMKISSAEKDREGLTIAVEGGLVVSSSPCSIKGTVVEVRDLFYNTPVRLKFLKSDFTENHHIIETVINSAICNENISFYLHIDKSETLALSVASNRLHRLTQIYGKDMTDKFVTAEIQEDDYNILIFYSQKDFYQNRKFQYIFVNNRPVKDIALSRSIYNSLKDIIPEDKHPAFFIYIDVNPKIVDFNVHPAKREVRFMDKSIIFELINRAINKRESTKEQGKLTVLNEYENKDFYSKTEHDYTFSSCLVQENKIDYKGTNLFANYISIGDTFIALSHERGLLLVDYHAVHERINYEKILHRKIKTVPLLFPCTVELDSSSYQAIKKNLSVLSELSIEIEDFGNNSVIVRAMPDFAIHADIEVIIKDLTAIFINRDNAFEDSVNPIEQIKRKVSASIACHASLRGRGELPDKAGIKVLLDELDRTTNPDSCPHGRPTRIFISHNELLKRFKKI